MKVFYPITLDVKKTNVQEIVRTNQGEGADRELCFSLISGNQKINLTAENTVSIIGKKPDGTVFDNACNIKNGKAYYYLTTQNLAVVGDVDCQLKVVSDGVTYSAKFTLHVEEATVPDKTIESSDEFTELVQLIQTAGKGKVYTGTTTPGTDPENYPLVKENDVYLKIETDTITIYEATSVSTTVTWSEKFEIYSENHIDNELTKINRVFNNKTGNVNQEYVELEITDFTSGRVKNSVSVGGELQTESSDTWEYATIEVEDYKDFKIQFKSPASSYAKYIVGVDENNIVTEIHGESTPDEATVQTVEFTALSTTKTIYISDLASNLSANFYVKEKEYVSLQKQIDDIVSLDLQEQIDNLKDLENESANAIIDLNLKTGNVKQEYKDVEVAEFTLGRAKNSSTDTAVGKTFQLESSTTWKYTTIEVDDYKDFKIQFKSPASAYAYYIVGVDEDGVITELHGEATASAATVQTVEFTALSTTKTIYISDLAANLSANFYVKEKEYISLQSQANSLQERLIELDELNNDIDELNLQIGDVKQDYIELEIDDFTLGRSKYNNAVGSGFALESSETWKYTTVEVGDYKDFKIQFSSPASSYAKYIVGVDENNIVTEIHGESTPDQATTQTVEFTCLATTKTLYISDLAANLSANFYVKEKEYISLQSQIDDITEEIEELKDNTTYNISVADFNSASFDNMNDNRALILYL